MIDTYTTLHVHSEYSTALLSFTDSIIKIQKALAWCYENGLKGMSLSDHEGVSGFVELEQAMKELNPERTFQHIFANEIYLISEEENDWHTSEEKRTTYYHFLLNALDEVGLHQLYELSSRAWLRSYMYRGLRRRPTFYSDIEEVIGNNQGHIVGSTACLGGRLPKYILENNMNGAKDFIKWGKQTFGDDCFYLECQPCYEDNEEQLAVNKALWRLHEASNTPIIVTTDAHYMGKEDKKIHKAFLNSKDGGDTREADAFYATAHLFTPKYLRKLLYVSGFDDAQIDEMFNNTNQIAERVQPITLKKTTQVPALPEIPKFKIRHEFKSYYPKYEFINYYANSKDPYEQYYFAQVESGLIEHANSHSLNIEKYLDQINTEMEQVKGLGDIFDHQRMSDYFTVVQKVVDLIWSEGDSLVGIGRGSAGCYTTNKLLGITGIDPIEDGLEGFYPWWRFCSIARSDSIFDIDIDIQSFKKEQIIKAIKNYFGERRVCQCVTWGRLSSKTSIERAAKGLGISDDVAGYIKSLIPVKRGQIYSIKDCLEGNVDKKRDKVPEFANEIKKYPSLLETALAFEGLIISSGVHAGALNVLKTDFTDTGALMVSSNGAIINQYDLHMGEYCGQLKFDLLSIDCLENIRACMNLLLENGYMEWQGTLRDTYNYYLSYDVLEKDNQDMWALLPEMVAAFQYDTRAGKEALRKIGAKDLTELTLANGLMRLQTSNTEQPMDMYVRYKKDINEWYKDMTEYGLTQEEQDIYKDLLGKYCGLCIAQETMMIALMDKRVCNFTLKEADKARKAVAKKSEKALNETAERLYRKGAECGRSKIFLDYLWLVQIEMSKSYAFAFCHSHEYSTECLQELNLYFKYPKVFWNTSVVTTQSQTEDERENSATTVDYGKIAQSIYKASNNGVTVNPPSVNKSGVAFTPEVETNSILFGLGGIASINADIANQVISNRPYHSFKQFYTANSYDGTLITPSKFIQLIKAGCFDCFDQDRVAVMKRYVMYSTSPKNALTMANLPKAITMGVDAPKALTAPYNWSKYVCSPQFFYSNHPKFKSKKIYWLDHKATVYFERNYKSAMQEDVDWYYENDKLLIVDKAIEKAIKPCTEALKEYINTAEFIKAYNIAEMKAKFDELTKGNSDPNHWSMEAVSYYSKEHELAKVDFERYNIDRFDDLPVEPVFVEKSWGERTWKQYELASICGCCLDKNDNRHTVTILTPENDVVNVKMNAGAYAHYKSQLSEVVDGKKSVIEKPWVVRGSLLIFCGYRRGDTEFVCKKYKNSIYSHQVQKINRVYEDGSIDIISERYGSNEE